jgi:hypothetical protein
MCTAKYRAAAIASEIIDFHAFAKGSIDLPLSFEEELTKRFVDSIVVKQDDIIKAAFKLKGLNPDDLEMVKRDITRVTIEGDPFEHVYYKFGTAEEIRIISIGPVEFGNKPRNIADPIKVEASCKYY